MIQQRPGQRRRLCSPPIFLEILCEEGMDFESFESRSISAGHAVIAEAMSMALERVEIKALAAYGSKEESGKKVRRAGCVHHGCVASPDSFWTQGVAAIGTRFDLSKVERCRLGTDGEGWCERGSEFFPSRISVTGHLDPFHVNRAVLSCFDAGNREGAWHVLGVLNDGGREEACKLLELMAMHGIAREKRSAEVAAYLRNNIDLIAVEGPSLGTMESENQHFYGARGRRPWRASSAAGTPTARCPA